MNEQNINGLLTLIPIEELFPHPDNPRSDLGDLSELAESIKAKGIMQNLTVIRGHYMTKDECIEMAMKEGLTKSDAAYSYNRDNAFSPDFYTIIIGHRRRAAAALAGISMLPCVITEMDEKDQISTMLLENIQRNNLTLADQAQGFQMMIDLGDSVEGISDKTGLSKSTVRKRLKLASLDHKKLAAAEPRGGTIEDLIAIADIRDEKTRDSLMSSLGTNNFAWNLTRAQRDQRISDLMPDIKKYMKSIGAKKDDKINTWSERYKLVSEVDIKDFSSGCFDKKIKAGKTYFWNINVSIIKLYTNAPKPKNQKAPPKSDKEILADKRRELLADLSSLAYDRRKDFVADFVITKSTENIVNDWLWEIIYKKLSGELNISLGAELLCELTGEEFKEYKYSFKRENIDKFVARSPKTAPLVLLQTICGDSRNLCYFEKCYGEYLPLYKKSPTLDFIYDRLCALGYEMSDDELALRNGTHKLLEVEKNG